MSLNSSYSQTEDLHYSPVNIMPVDGRHQESEASSVDSIHSYPDPANRSFTQPVMAASSSSSLPPPSYNSYYHYPVPGHHPPRPHLPGPGPGPPAQLYGHSVGHQHHHPHQSLPPHLTRVHYSTGYGTQQFPVIMTDELVSGTKHNGRMSPVRRFYLLLCTFDLLFTCLLWIISILVTGKDLYNELDMQVVHYNIKSSMFDCVLASAARFTFSCIFYGIMSISHWWVITLTTTGTVSFLVAKVLKFEFNKFQPLTYNVMLVLLSFIISWGEVWFFDLRMIPLERKAREIWGDYQAKTRGDEDPEQEERRPLLGGGMMERFMEGSTLYEGSVGNFYSPFESPNASDDEDDEDDETGVRIPRRFRRKKDHPLSDQEREYKKLGAGLLATAWATLNTGDWRLERKLDNGDMVQARTLPSGKKVFKLTGYVDMAPRLLLEELFYKMEQVPAWNPTLVECRVIQPIDQYTDISYQVCAEAGGGVVSTRDFVNLRHWAAVEDGVLVSAGGSVEHPAMPPQRGRVRGENGPTCWALRPVATCPDTCLFQWLLDTDLKGWIPQRVIDKALSGAQLDYIAHIRTRAAELARAGAGGLDTSIASCEDIVVNT